MSSKYAPGAFSLFAVGCILISGMAVLGLAVSCSPPPPESAPGPAVGEVEPAPSAPATGAKSIVMAYDCGPQMWVVTEYRPAEDRMVVFIPGTTAFLPRAEAASGAKYSDGEITFWSKGDAGSLEISPGDAYGCEINRKRTLIEAAKLDGADFLARGNEPGWTLRIYPARLVLVTNYGEDRFESEIEGREEDKAGRSTTFQGRAGAETLVVTLRGEPCQDDMSGEGFPTSVELLVGEKRFRGCGNALH